MDTENKKISVYGIFDSVMAAENGVSALKNAGFAASDVSALLPEGDQTKQFAIEKGTKAPDGATAGGASGAILGGALGWLAGIGSLAIPGVGPLIAAGPIMAALAGASLGTAVGALSGALIGLGIPEYEAKRYEGRIAKGGVLVSVHCSSNERCDHAKMILEDADASDISSHSEANSERDRRPETDRRQTL